jgi:hypothetical protein
MRNALLKGSRWIFLVALFTLSLGCDLKREPTSLKPHDRAARAVGPARRPPFFHAGFAYSRIGGNYDSDISSHELKKMRAAGAGAVQFLAYAYVNRLNAPEIRMEQEHSDRILSGGVARARALGLRAMLKLHTWGPGFHEGKFPADIAMNGSDAWRAFMANYRLYALRYARLAEDTGVDVFCIGTELAQASQAAVLAGDWRSLIEEVRSIYSGSLTYAAHSSEVEGVPFWDLLDYIGINGYYPIAGLPAALASLERLSVRWNRPVLFTEAGFASSSHALTEPWRAGPNKASPASVRLDLQAEGFRRLLIELWHSDFVWGVYIWKWHPNPDWGGPTNADHTPQGKPAIDVIRNFYQRLPARAASGKMPKKDAE